MRPLLIRGPIRVLNIGTGGGIETLRLLSRGNHVTAIEIDKQTAIRTQQRIDRNGFSNRFNLIVGHLCSVQVQEKFDEVFICEVLEHIKDDLSALRRISEWLAPGGRLILSTPTASYGQIPIQQLSINEDGGHVRVGYDGPELDQMMGKFDLFTLKRIFNGNPVIQKIHFVEKKFRMNDNFVVKSIGYFISIIARVFMPVIDILPYQPYNQITIGIKKYW